MCCLCYTEPVRNVGKQKFRDHDGAVVLHLCRHMASDGASFVHSVQNAVGYLFRNLCMTSQTLSHLKE